MTYDDFNLKIIRFEFSNLNLVNSGGVDGTRTRDPRRDRPVF